MRAVGNSSKLFCERWGERTASGAARKALEVLIPTSSKAAIPVDVDSAAKYVGIGQVFDVEMTNVDGLLSSTSSGTYIASLRKDQSPARRRFTLAHEIGHAIVYRSIGHQGELDRDAQLQCRAETVSDKDEERLCDVLATELSMPRTQFLQAMEETGVSASTIPLIAQRFGVSLQAASRRVAEILPYEIGVGLWTANGENVRFVPRWYVTKNKARAPDYAIEAGQPGAACFTDRIVRGWHWIPLLGQMDKYFLDVFPLGGGRKSWLVVAVFSNAAQQIMMAISKGRAPIPARQIPLIGE